MRNKKINIITWLDRSPKRNLDIMNIREWIQVVTSTDTATAFKELIPRVIRRRAVDLLTKRRNAVLLNRVLSGSHPSKPTHSDIAPVSYSLR